MDNYSTVEYPVIEEAYLASKAKAEDARNCWVEKEQVVEVLKCVEAKRAEAK